MSSTAQEISPHPSQEISPELRERLTRLEIKLDLYNERLHELMRRIEQLENASSRRFLRR
ncbi:hypothetical protein SAMN05421831_1113 [Allopseudospirillum japonicum]|uniref:Uncharacterized protein n=1 Tax=Allopseudospirillum japonicum TaxID=64971 RepID=A0A1H6TV24_9GAMM|nr:hypothetical protein [Allopseudospirillum japonicum]SEI81097.1 hypothetical protein SAMN05421831_1113 [Allopseudospirillum japonicum]